jgi:hypothetical protein
MVTENRKPRRYAVLVRLNDVEEGGLVLLQERESLPRAQILRRLLIREVRAGSQTGEPGVHSASR